MKYLFLVWAGLWRKPPRTMFTVAALAVGFLLFGLLQGVGSAFDRAIQRQRIDRLLTDPRYGEPLPVRYAEEIQRIPGVTQLTWIAPLFAYYQDPKNSVLVLATDPSRFFKVRGEFETSAEHLQALGDTRMGALVLDSLAQQLNWSIGDRVTVQAPLPKLDGGSDWTFEIVGFIRAPDQPGQAGFVLANYDYVNEARAADTGTASRFVVLIDDPQKSAEVSYAIDELFANSSAPTATQAESELAQAQLAAIGDISRITIAVIGAVFFSVLFLTGNVVLQSLRERTAEFGVLKTLGFSDTTVLILVVLEAAILCTLGAALGLGSAAGIFPLVSGSLPAVSGWLGAPSLSLKVLASGFAFAFLLAIVSGAIPAWSARRLKIIDALRLRV